MSAGKTNTAVMLNIPPGETSAQPAGPRLVEKPPATRAHEIALAALTQFCKWFTARFRGVQTTIERTENRDGGRQITECIDRPLERVTVDTLADDVTGIHITVRYNGKCRKLEVAGPRWLRLHSNAAGFPEILEIGYEEGKLALHFTGGLSPGEVFTANSWGE